MAAIDLRYARALGQVVAEQKLDSAAVEQQLADFVATFEGSSELREVLQNPSIAEAQKLGVLDAIATKLNMGKTVRNFVAVIAHHERLHELADIVAAYHSVADESKHIAEATVTSAHPLDENNRKLLEQKIADMTGGEHVHATYDVDASLLGGAIVKVGSTVYDGSVRAQLQMLKQKLVAAV